MNERSGYRHCGDRRGPAHSCEYIEPSRVARLPDVTINQLLRVLDRADVVSALNRLKAGYGLRVVK
jgi:hypothetical protein